VKWKGFDEEDPGWEPLQVMAEDIPKLVTDFLEDMKSSGTALQRRLASATDITPLTTR